MKEDWIKFQEAAKQCRKVCNATKTNFITTSIDGNKKKLFKFIKSKRRDISGVSPLLDKQGVPQLLRIRKEKKLVILFSPEMVLSNY